MSELEIQEYVDSQRTVMVATIGFDEWPHLVPLWFVHESTDIVAWTYRRSQKVRNLQRLPKATLMLESGTEYSELSGASNPAGPRT